MLATAELPSPSYSMGATADRASSRLYGGGIEAADIYGHFPTFYPAGGSGGGCLAQLDGHPLAALAAISTPTTPTSARPTSASSEVVQRPGRGRKRRKLLPSDDTRSATLGGCAYASIDDPLKKDVYNILDLLVGWVTTAVDSGSEAQMRKLQTLRSAAPTDEAIAMFEGPKAKRKRQQTKKPPTHEPSEYDLFIEKLQAQLKLCPLPTLTYEQSSFADTSLPAFADITQVPEEMGECRRMREIAWALRTSF